MQSNKKALINSLVNVKMASAKAGCPVKFCWPCFFTSGGK